MQKTQLIKLINERQSFLCVGLDTDPNKIPSGVSMLEFNKAIIDATAEYCVAYKPNLAFYESLGAKGWELLQETIAYIGKSHFTIADAKRGDIGNTSSYYAKTFFETYDFDSVTIAPYMGEDSVKPFLATEGKWGIILALTSNSGADDFELLKLERGLPLWQQVLHTSTRWGSDENTMYVVGATRPELLQQVRAIVPNHFLLVPGVGAQGGSLAEVCKYGLNTDVGLLINASRSILYADHAADKYAAAAAKEAKSMQQEMAAILLSR